MSRADHGLKAGAALTRRLSNSSIRTGSRFLAKKYIASAIVATAAAAALLIRAAAPDPRPAEDFVDLVGGTPIAYDGFQRLWNWHIEGSETPSGHTYWTMGARQPAYLGRYRSNAVTGRPSIAYLPLDEAPTVIAGEFVFTGPGKQNAVIGTAKEGFGRGSIQLAVYLDHWRLFAVEYPIVDPYPILARGEFNPPLKVGTPYRMSLTYHHDKDGHVTVRVPRHAERVIHPYVKLFWGNQFGIQLRHTTPDSGRIEFLRIAAR